MNLLLRPSYFLQGYRPEPGAAVNARVGGRRLILRYDLVAMLNGGRNDRPA